MKKRIALLLVVCMMGLLFCGCEHTTGLSDRGDTVEKNAKTAVSIGEVSIAEYVIVWESMSAREAGYELQAYILRTSGAEIPVVSHAEEGQHTITLRTDRDMTEEKTLTITDGEVLLAARDKELLYDTVYLFADMYLGWIKSGTAEAHISNRNTTLHIPDQVCEKEAWIAEREPIITLWNVNWTRNIYADSSVSVKNNLMYYTEDQLYEYVKMMKYCGFTGIQVTDMCSAWAGLGSWQAVHEKIRILAEAAHSLDMKFTLWVWGAEFSEFAWVDNDVTYEKKDGFAYKNEEVCAVFEKYYSIYADLADCCDRVIGHYYDPGYLDTSEDVAYFAKLLRDKFLAVNPEIDFGVSCWVDAFDKNVLVAELGTDITLYEQGYRSDAGQYNTFRGTVKNLGCRLGTWAWNTCEMEIDQLAQMNFNLEHIRSVYQTARNYDGVMKPDYWSEMDSYHVLNAFSLYCAGQLLIDPDVETEELMNRLSVAVVGEEYAEAFAEMLDIIQDARTGSSYETYFWSEEDYILKSADYPAEEILKRCEAVIPVLEEMIGKDLETNTFPLPVSLKDVLRLMQPHLEQIRSFAAFRIGLDGLEAAYEQGETAEQLSEKLAEIAAPVNSYNTVTGAWGQVEARAQQELIAEFCERTGAEAPQDASLRANRKLHIYAQMVTNQLGKQSPVLSYSPYYQYGVAYGYEETLELVDELVEEGLLIQNEDGSVYLANWDNYIYSFNE